MSLPSAIRLLYWFIHPEVVWHKETLTGSSQGKQTHTHQAGFWIVGRNCSARRKATYTEEEHANSIQKGIQVLKYGDICCEVNVLTAILLSLGIRELERMTSGDSAGRYTLRTYFSFEAEKHIYIIYLQYIFIKMM